MGCNASLPLYDVGPLGECTDPLFCAYARFLDPDSDPYDTVTIETASEDERSFKIGITKVTDMFSRDFHELRMREGISDEDFFQSLVGGESYHLDSNSKGCSFFSRTHDYKYIMKQIKDVEAMHFKKMAKGLFQHWKKNENSLLNRIYAAFTMWNKVSGSRSFIIVRDAFPHDFSMLKSQYDLKGAKNNNRKRKAWERTKKDLDFHADFAEKGKMFSPSISKALNSVLEKDTYFLKEWRCMDYSLLISVYEDHVGVPENDAEIIDCQEIGCVRFCIIDFLRKFDNAKWREAKMKNTFRRDSSVQNPDFFRDRFLREIFFTLSPEQKGTNEASLDIIQEESNETIFQLRLAYE